MKLPDEECSRVASSGWLTELEKLLFDGGPNLMIDDATVRMLIGALKFERRRSAEIMSDLVNADRRIKVNADALIKISAIRDDIVARQSINWSRHIYPLVAALGEAGIEGRGYDKGRPIVECEAELIDAVCDADIATLPAEVRDARVAYQAVLK